MLHCPYAQLSGHNNAAGFPLVLDTPGLPAINQHQFREHVLSVRTAIKGPILSAIAVLEC
jgi:hypothetical protein